ncbi:hypothetical protein EDO6_05115 [Paenibacillus xylanexedens]|nr:hypothetical protein EDO6_05115 [Paenibacillus xylanexedens]
MHEAIAAFPGELGGLQTVGYARGGTSARLGEDRDVREVLS